MVYLGILVTRKLLGSQKILAEMPFFARCPSNKIAWLKGASEISFNFSVKMLDSSVRQKIFCYYYYLYFSLFICELENVLIIDLYHYFCCFLVGTDGPTSHKFFSVNLFQFLSVRYH